MFVGAPTNAPTCLFHPVCGYGEEPNSPATGKLFFKRMQQHETLKCNCRSPNQRSHMSPPPIFICCEESFFLKRMQQHETLKT